MEKIHIAACSCKLRSSNPSWSSQGTNQFCRYPPPKSKLFLLEQENRTGNPIGWIWGFHYGACATALFVKSPAEQRTDSWTTSKDYLNFSVFCRPRFERVILAIAMMDVAKNASNPASRKYVFGNVSGLLLIVCFSLAGDHRCLLLN